MLCLCRQAHIPADKLAEVRRVLYGSNEGGPVQPVDLSPEISCVASSSNFDLQAYRFAAGPEQLRPPRVVRAALVQHSIAAPTTAPYAEQRQAIHERVRQIVDAAGAAGVQVLCLQEAFHMPFAFCTRERSWCEFAEDAESGPSVELCRELVSTLLAAWRACTRQGYWTCAGSTARVRKSRLPPHLAGPRATAAPVVCAGAGGQAPHGHGVSHLGAGLGARRHGVEHCSCDRAPGQRGGEAQEGAARCSTAPCPALPCMLALQPSSAHICWCRLCRRAAWWTADWTATLHSVCEQPRLLFTSPASPALPPEPHPARGRLQREHLLHGGQHRASGL